MELSELADAKRDGNLFAECGCFRAGGLVLLVLLPTFYVVVQNVFVGAIIPELRRSWGSNRPSSFPFSGTRGLPSSPDVD